ncbi:MAG TPA: hypothetical protein VGN12_06020 [Pirellulales bacterium]|jgi:hypothetical protein
MAIKAFDPRDAQLYQRASLGKWLFFSSRIQREAHSIYAALHRSERWNATAAIVAEPSCGDSGLSFATRVSKDNTFALANFADA